MKMVIPVAVWGGLALLVGSSLLSPAPRAGDARVPLVEDFAELGREADARRLPVLVLFAAEHCEYCQRLEAEFLEPMLLSGQYEDRVIIRKLMVDSWAPLRDFGGSRIGANEFAERHAVDVTPTVMLFDSEGRPLGRRLIGLNNVHFYGAYLDRAIDKAYQALNPS